MRTAPVSLTRRALLAGTALAVAGCRTRRPARPDPDAAAMASAGDTERRLVEAYAALAAAATGAQAVAFGRLRDIHSAHLTALGGHIGTPSPGRSTAAG